MRSYTVLPVNGAPVWREIPTLEVDCVQWLPADGIAMTQQLCYDAAYLYIRQQARERNIRATHNGYLRQVCEDSCMEFFFAPADDGRYFNCEINPNGCVRLGYGTAALRTQLVPREIEQQLCVESARTDDGWCLTYRIPLALLQLFYPELRYRPGTVLRGNCYKCGDLTDHPHYLSWNEVQSDTPSFHRPQDFGLLVFG